MRRRGWSSTRCFLPGWEEGLFPNQRALDEGGNKALEEERRLAYVGLTRARKRAVVSFAANRRIYANWQSSIPSRFIDELPEAHVERAGSAALQRERQVLAPSVFGNGPLVARRSQQPPAWEQPAPPRAPGQNPGRAATFCHQKFGYGQVTQCRWTTSWISSLRKPARSVSWTASWRKHEAPGYEA